MTRSDRLFRLLQALRTLPAPVTAVQLAKETDVSVRSIYRDIESLRAAGAEIGGERGYGYCLIEDGTLPPQMFSRLEIEALALGMAQAQVRRLGDAALAKAASAVLGKVSATLPSLAQQHIFHAVSQAHQFEARSTRLPDMQLLREACWREEALLIRYTDKQEVVTDRNIWPLAIVYVHEMLVVLAKCCLRDDFRIFRVERIQTLAVTHLSFRPKRVGLLRDYLAQLASS